MLSEFALLDRIKGVTRNISSNTLLKGIGDDCAVLKMDARKLALLTTDSFNEGVHFSRRFSGFHNAGIKAATGAMSDIYAMGGECTALLVSLGIPGNCTEKEILDFYRGLKKVCALCRCPVAGGDTTGSKGRFFAALTVLGTVPAGDVKFRSGAQPGDRVFLTGQVGYSLAGLRLLKKGIRTGSSIVKKALSRHLRPLPCLAGAVLGRLPEVHAMIDVSDGLSSELNHIARESGVAISLDPTPLISDPGLQEVAKFSGVSAEDLAFRSGEEYELLFTAARKPGRVPCMEIGRVVKRSKGEVRFEKDGRLIAPSGFNHFIKR